MLQSINRVDFEYVGNVVMVTLQDKQILDETNIQIIGNTLFTLFKDGRTCPHLVIDFSNVLEMSSAFIGKLIRLHSSVMACGGRGLALCSLNQKLTKTFEIMRFDKVFLIHDTREQALEAVKTAPHPAPA